MSNIIIIPPFRRTTVKFNNFRWLEDEDWSPDDMLFFKKEKEKALKSYNKSLIQQNLKKIKHEANRKRWILKNEQKAVGWTEIHTFSDKYNKGDLFYKIPDSCTTKTLPIIISTIFITGKLDQVRVHNCCDQISNDMSNFPQKKIYAFTGNPVYEPKIKITNVTDISSEMWWSSNLGNETKDQVKHLQERMIREEKRLRQQSCPPPKKTKPLIVKLFFPWR